jgi:alkylation response protein AidB-like acyl-CoA dehydrogenase
MTTSALRPVASELEAWLDMHAEAIDTAQDLAPELLPRLGQAGLFRVGVPFDLGGSGGVIGDAIEAVANVAEQSLAAAFVFWGQRTFIEYLLQSPNETLRTRWLDRLLSGELAGATGLSNAMKYLSNIEPLQMKARLLDHAGGHDRWTLDGSLPWITNLRPEGFVAAAAFDHASEDGGMPPSIFAIPHDMPGVTRSVDLDLIALRSSNTAALRVEGTVLDHTFLITADAPAWLARVRPGFLGLQCGMSIGLARRCLATVGETSAISRAAVEEEAAGARTRRPHASSERRRGQRHVRVRASSAVRDPHRTGGSGCGRRRARNPSDRRPGLFARPDRHCPPHARGRVRAYRYA